MQQFVIIGLGAFGIQMLEELSLSNVEVLIIDRNKERIERYKNKATSAYITDVVNVEALKKLIPENLAAAIVDLGENFEASVLVANHLKKMNIKKILVQAKSTEHAEILGIVGATQVVIPNREASKRIVPRLVSSTLLNYLSIASDMVIAEAELPKRLIGKTVLEANLRKDLRLNIIAVRKAEAEEFGFITPEYIFSSSDVLLFASDEAGLAAFTGFEPLEKKGLSALFKRFFHN